MPLDSTGDQPAASQQASDNRPDFSQATDSRSNFNDLQQSARDSYTRDSGNSQSIDFSQHGDIYASNNSNNNFGRTDSAQSPTADSTAGSDVHPGMTKPTEETLKKEKEESEKDTRTDPLTKVENVDASPKYAREMDDAYKALPDNIRNYADQNKLDVKAVKNLGEHWPELHDVHQTGYPQGSTFSNNSTSAYDGKRNEVAMSQNKTDGPVADTVDHEVMHAIDNYQGRPSQSPEFKEAYDKDMANMRDEEKVALSYMTANDTAARAKEETFAEVGANLISKNPDAGKGLYSAARYFPETTKFVSGVIKDIK